MFANLPAPLPDEIAYSLVARFMQSWGYIYRPQLLHICGNQPARHINVDVPHRIRQIVDVLEPGCSISEHQFAQFHTTLPYLVATLSHERRRKILAELELPEHRLACILGVRKNWLLAPSKLRFCVDCISEDRLQYGHLYWHRSHQLPGVVVCQKHHSLLYNSSVDRYSENVFLYVAASASNCVPIPSFREAWIINRDISMTIAERSLALLEKRLGLPASISNAGYRDLLFKHGYRTGKSRVSLGRLDEEFGAFLKRLNGRAEASVEAKWWHALIWNMDKQLTPLHHILFRIFLSSSSQYDDTAYWRTPN